MNTVTSADRAAPSHMPAAREAALASCIGGAVEYCDFFILGTAMVLVFGNARGVRA